MPKEGYKQTEEHRQKLGKARMGHIVSDEARKKIGRANSINLKGHKISDETRAKLSKAAEGHITSEGTRRKIGKANSIKLKGKHLTMEHKKKIGEAGEGHIVSEETKRKISQSEKGKFVSKKTRRKIGESHKGEKCNFWQGGISFEPYTIQFNRELKELIRQRDNYKCQLCGMPECENIQKLDIHHIDYDKKNCLPSNLVSLCKSCHAKINNNRKYWTDYFLGGELCL